MVIQLVRTTRCNKAVNGAIEFDLWGKHQKIDTLENADYIIPAGRYPLRKTWSPRFKKFMPEICDVPERDGIRIHMGTKPEHSTGCVLVSYMGLETIKAFINYIEKYYEEEDLFIEITPEG